MLHRLIHFLFTERRFVIYQSTGIMREYRISRWLIFSLYAVFLFAFFWSVTVTYLYFIHSNALFDDSNTVAEYKEKYKKALSEFIAYKDSMKAISIKRENEYKKLVNVLEKNKSVTVQDKEKYIRAQQLTLAEVNFLSEKLDDFVFSSNLRKIDVTNPYYKLTRAEIQRDVAWQEQQNVRKQNNELIKLSLSIREAQNKLLDKVELLAKDNLRDIESVLLKLNRSFAQIDLMGRDKLLHLATKIEDGFGGPFIPIEKTYIADAVMSDRYKTVNKVVDMWDGLLKVRNILPIGYPSKSKYITSGFGEREDPFLKVPAMHRGIDFRGKIGTPLFTTAPGRVIRANQAHDYGLFVEVDHGMGFTTLYAHLSKISVSVGDQLNTGDVVGLAGSTGRSTGPHLHYEVRYKKRPINPYSFVVAAD